MIIHGMYSELVLGNVNNTDMVDLVTLYSECMYGLFA